MNELSTTLSPYLSLIVLHSPDAIGLVMPFLAETITRKVTNQNWKFTIVLALCIVAALLLNINNIKMGNPEEVLTSATLIFTASQVVFRYYFKNSALREKMQPATK